MEIFELAIEFEFNGEKNVIYPSLIIHNKELTLVDTGYPDFLPLIEKEIRKYGYSLDHLKNIVITHYDDDHIGSLFDLKQKYPWVKVFASDIESKYISGSVKGERLVQAEAMLEKLPSEEIEFGKWFIQQLRNLKHVSVDETVHDGSKILDGKCTVVATPGHTSGHISLYFPSLKALITGDAAVHDNGKLEIANRQFCLDVEKAEQSLEKIKQLDVKTFYCYHGGKLTV